MFGKALALRTQRPIFPMIALLALVFGSVMPMWFAAWQSYTHLNTPPRLDLTSLPLSFEPNTQQPDSSVRYLVHASGGTFYFSPSEVVLSLPQAGLPSRDADAVRTTGTASAPAQIKDLALSSVHLRFLGANPSPTIGNDASLPGKVNYFIGNDPAKWRTDVPTYSGVTYKSLYPGINLSYGGTDGQLKGTYTVAASADPSLIRWTYAGVAAAGGVTVDQSGNLQIRVGEQSASEVMLTERAPIAWQQIGDGRVAVSASYKIGADGTIGFMLGSYNPSYPLIIDPTLTYSTFLGGTSGDQGRDITVDSSGNMYVMGYTSSGDYPIAGTPFQNTNHGNIDVVVSKISAAGTSLIFSTYLGGNGAGVDFGDDYGRGIAVDSTGNVYLTGDTYSPDFPLVAPIQSTYGGNRDVFVSKLNSAGSALVYSTLMGGPGEDVGYRIKVDSSGFAYVAGRTDSSNFPVLNAYQPTFGGVRDAFVAKFNQAGTALVYSTFLGGTSEDRAFELLVDGTGQVYVTGFSESTNFPTTAGAYNRIFSGDGGCVDNEGAGDAYVAKLSSTGTSLLLSTYLGGSTCDYGRG